MPIGYFKVKLDARSYVFRSIVLATLFFVGAVFAVVPDQKAGAPQANKDAKPRTEDVGPDKSLWVRTLDDAPGFWTAVLAGLTFVLAGVGLGQIFYLRRADETARISADAARKAAKAAKRSAVVAENTLVTAEAPFIFAKARKWREGDPLANGTRPGFAQVRLHNHGRSPAIVRDFYVGTFKSVGLPGPIGYPPPHSPLHRDVIIPAGESGDPRRFNEAAFRLVGGGSDDDPPDPHSAYWIIGQVRYADAFGAQYVTAFCFFLNSFSGKFYGVGGSAFNYRRRLTKAETREAEQSDAELPFRRQSADEA